MDISGECKSLPAPEIYTTEYTSTFPLCLAYERQSKSIMQIHLSQFSHRAKYNHHVFKKLVPCGRLTNTFVRFMVKHGARTPRTKQSIGVVGVESRRPEIVLGFNRSHDLLL